jgi:hypothetical protein
MKEKEREREKEKKRKKGRKTVTPMLFCSVFVSWC